MYDNPPLIGTTFRTGWVVCQVMTCLSHTLHVMVNWQCISKEVSSSEGDASV